MTDFIPADRPFTGRKMLLTIVTFFAVIIAVNGTMLTLAVKTFGGLVVGNSYVASQNFNADIAAAKAQPIRHWEFDLSTVGQDITLSVKDRDGSALTGLALSLELARPTHGRSTVTVPMAEVAPGRYAGPVSLAPGQWVATVSTGDGQTRSLTYRQGDGS